jgi:hypothetical protein
MYMQYAGKTRALRHRRPRLKSRRTRRVRRRRPRFLRGGASEAIYDAAAEVVDAQSAREAMQSKARLTGVLSTLLERDPRLALQHIVEVFAQSRAAIEAELSDAMTAPPKQRAAIIAKLKTLNEKQIKVVSDIAMPKTAGWGAAAWNAVAGVAATAVVAAVGAAAYHYAPPEAKAAMRNASTNVQTMAQNYGNQAVAQGKNAWSATGTAVQGFGNEAVSQGNNALGAIRDVLSKRQPPQLEDTNKVL